MYAFMAQVQGGKEMETAVLMDLFFQHMGIDKKIRVSTFEREKYQYLDENFRKGTVGYVLILSTEEIDHNIWFKLQAYLYDCGFFIKQPKAFDPEEMTFGPFLRAVLEKINDFIQKLNAPIFSSFLEKKKNKVKGIMSFVHTVLDYSKIKAYGTFVRWVSYVSRPVSVIDTG
ncbi:MAG: hypothetical protein BSOLF_0838 [Candidatus Carbobacillus altaicus]|uniref:Uncharacterized protein n=1 Tax=Candidatus Carbonibacillus altaicus TaxID=2163959 RepID=A0A2R6Y089_9BACL|nr:MAG: hypothetical protein BSOLF_0838 [Candidatus Carbobacillus altaicus]